MLERNGKVSCVTGPVRPSEAKLRRAQALAAGNGLGLEIARTLIDAKLKGQEQVLRERLRSPSCSRRSLRLSEQVGFRRHVRCDPHCRSKCGCLLLSGVARYPRDLAKGRSPKDPPPLEICRKPAVAVVWWTAFGCNPCPRRVELLLCPLQAETRLAVSALGLDPGLGVGLHTDTANRDSLALDVLEPIRPQIEAWLLNWIASEPFRRSDFFETGTGNCRLMSQLCTKLSGTASVWGKLVAPWTEYVARALSTAKKSGRECNRTPPTRLTQQHRTEAKGKVWTPRVKFSKADHLCRGCGKRIIKGRTHCGQCAVSSATERLVDVARVGRQTANSPQAQLKRGNTQRQNALAQHAWKPSDEPTWLTARFYAEKIQPLLAPLSASAIARQISVSRWYAGRIREGYRPHPRHWLALAKLVDRGLGLKAP